MYRAPDSAPRCPSCGGTELAPATRFYARGQHDCTPTVVFEVRGEQGFLGPPHEYFHADRARVCLACGHLMLGMSPEQLAKLRSRGPWLQPSLPG